MKKLLINFAKLGVSLALIIYLIQDVQKNNPDLFSRLQNEPKDWSLLLAAWGLVFTAVMLCFVRWYFLVRALDLPFRMRDAFRLGFLGYLLNFVSLGSVGGDLFKAVFIAREQPGRRTEAVTSVVVDRFIGLVGLMLVASVAVLTTDMSQFRADIQTLGHVTVVAAAMGMAGFLAMMFRFGTEGPIADYLCRPGFGSTFFRRVFDAARQYRQRRSVLWLCLLITIAVHTSCVLGFYCIARGLPDNAPSLAIHFFIVPLGLVSAVIPLPMEALGAFEAVLQYLYEQVTPDTVNAGQGLLVALVYRLIRILVALIGVAFYLTNRKEVDHVIHTTEEIEIKTEEGGGDTEVPEAAREAKLDLPDAGMQTAEFLRIQLRNCLTALGERSQQRSG